MGLYRRVVRVAMSLAGVGLITWIAYTKVPINATTVGFTYLLFVLIVASTWGFLEAFLCSIAATLVYNFFFLPPIGTFTISDPHNWISVFAFLATSLIASRLSDRAERRTQDAMEGRQDLERLYTLGRSILLIDESELFAKQLARRLAEAFELEAVALYDPRSAEIHRAGPLDFEGMDGQLRESALQGTAFTDPQRHRMIIAVRLGSEPIASLGVQGPRMPDSVLQSIGNLVAIGLERAKAQDLAHEVEVARRSERLRTTLIDAMAHEFKTPLTSIRAATTALLANPDQKQANATLLKIADEEAAHLEELIDNAMDTAQLDSDHIDLDLEISNLNDVVGEVVAAMESGAGDRRLQFASNGQLPPVAMDRRLMKIAIKQLLDNALKYSPATAPVAIRAFRKSGTLVVEITDHGKGIPEQEQTRIFERFYRSPSVQDQIPGSGLGLSIAYRILQVHKGDLTVRSRPGETTFRLVLPMESTGDGR